MLYSKYCNTGFGLTNIEIEFEIRNSIFDPYDLSFDD